MNQKEIKELIDFLIEKDVAEFELERGDVKLRVKRGGQPTILQTATPSTIGAAAVQPAAVPPPAAVSSPSRSEAVPAAAPAPTAPSEENESSWQIVRSPIVGTFYESPSPGAPAFLKTGDSVSVGQVVCIVEAMKLMNEIESDFAGVVVKTYVSNGQPVEYGQPLFAIRPN